ncbi:MAG: glycyl-radical enzyme activating protein [Proteobacteria bacterium]|nr:glycyl-radical enzyme activating protein [Pseudomonadota bacterium]
MEQGLVFNIQRFSTHDGPGIRTTVFLKGCPLTCLWCSNPESQSRKSQLMIRDIKCGGCGECIKVCSEKAVFFDEQGKRRIAWDRCTQCFECVEACVYGAMTSMGEVMTVREIVETVDKDRVFYKNSGGGVTISGGEPLGQPAFLEKLLFQLKNKAYHIALDTSGQAPRRVLERLLPSVDLVLFDIKHLDTERHLEAAGVGNELILENAKFVASRVRTWFRIPLIENFNDSATHVGRIAKMALDLGVEKISLLPFHEGGNAKTTQIGADSAVYQAKPPSQKHLEKLMRTIAKEGIRASVGS